MAALDVICIGAVNYDYMFHCTAFDLIITDKEGSEDLNDGLADVEGDIYELVMKGKEYTTQIGGSAFITLKVIKHILRDLQVAYVGTCGTPNAFDFRYGKTNNLDMELAQRIIDFTSGSTFAIDGNLQKISNYIFIITPPSVDISGDFQDILSGAIDLPSLHTEF